MNDTKTISFSMDAAGQLRAADFKPRSLKKVLESELGEDWKKSPKKLLKAMTRVSDLYTVIFAARQRMIPEYIAKYEALHDKVRELSAQGFPPRTISTPHNPMMSLSSTPKRAATRFAATVHSR